MSLAEVAHHACESLQFSGFISQRHRNGVSPEARPVLPQLPAFNAEMAVSRGAFQFLLRLRARILVAKIEKTDVFTNDLIGAVTVNALCSRIPVGYTSLYVQEEQCIVLYP